MLDSFFIVGWWLFCYFLLLVASDCYWLVPIVVLIQICEHLVKTSKSIFNIAWYNSLLTATIQHYCYGIKNI